MKRAGLAALGILGGAALLSTANANLLSWSPTGTESGGQGTWDTTSSAWYNGTIMMPWNNAAGDSASFGGASGSVTLSGVLRVQDLSFVTDGYTLTGGSISMATAQSTVTVASGDTATLGSIVTGAGLMSVMGPGKLILTGANTYTGGTSVAGGGTLEIASDSNLGASGGLLTLGNGSSGTLNITGMYSSARSVAVALGGGNINVSPGMTATFNGVVSGSGTLDFGGAGLAVLNGANTFAGTLQIEAGSAVQVGTGGTTGALGTGPTVNNGRLAFNLSNAYTYGGNISGTGSLWNTGTGTTVLTGTASQTGGTTISAGVLQIANNGTSGWITGNITDNGKLNFFRSDTNTFSGVISGSGVVRNSAGILTLSGANTYSGGTEIQGGVLQVSTDANLGAASSGVTFTGTGGATLKALASFTSSRNIVLLNSGVEYISSVNGTTLTLTGNISGVGGFNVGSGLVDLESTANTYSGTTQIGPGATLQINNVSSLGHTVNIYFPGGGTGILRVMSSGTVAQNIGMSNSAYTSGGIDAYNGSVVTLNGTITGSGGGINFYGGGTGGGSVILNGNNTYTGTSVFSTGSRVVVSQDSNLGAASTALVFGNGTLATTSAFSSSRTLGFNAAGTIDVAGGTTLTLSGASSGVGALTKANAGVLVLSGTTTRTGTNTISGGTLQIGDGGTTGSLGTGNVTDNATLAFNHSDSTSWANIISGSGAVTQMGSGITTLTGNNTYTGATTVSAGALYVNGNQAIGTGLTTVASGATLGGNGTLGGSVVIADGGTLDPGASPGAVGTLTIKGSLALSAGSVLNYSLGQAGTPGGLLNDLTVVNGNLTLAGTLNVTTSAGGTFDAGVYRIISYSGTLTNNGLVLGSLPSGANSALQTSTPGQINLINNYAGTTFWDGATNHNNGVIEGGAGVWNTGSGAISNWTDGFGIANNAYTTDFAVFQGAPGVVTVDDSLGQVAVTGMQFMTNGYRVSGDSILLNETTAGSGFTTVRVGDGTAAGSAYTTTIGSTLGGAAGLSKTDLGTLILTGTNTYTGGTNISGGTLQLGDGTTNGSVLGDIADGSLLALKPASGTTMALSGILSGSGSLNLIGAGMVVLTGANTYSGKTTITSGTLQIGDGTNAGTQVGSGNIVNNAALVFMPATGSVFNYGGIITGTGSVTQNGPGTTVFTSLNTYTGATTITSGVLQLGDGTINHDSRIVSNVNNNGTLAFDYYNGNTYSGVISGSGNVSQLSGTTTLSGVNTYTGGTIITGGSLSVASDANLGDASGLLTFNGGDLFGSGSSANIARNILIGSGGGLLTGTLTLSGQISGSGILSVVGGNSTITGMNNTWSGGTMLSDSGVLTVGTGSTLGSGAITFQCNTTCDHSWSSGGNLMANSDLLLTNDIVLGNTGFAQTNPVGGINTSAGATLTLQGNLAITSSAGVGLVKAGGGTLVLDNSGYSNTDSKAILNVQAGTVQVGAGDARGSIGAMPVTLAAGSTLAFNRIDTVSYDGIISGGGALQQMGSGTTILTGNNTYTGGTAISAGTLQLGSGGATGWVTGDITDNGTLVFNRSDNVTYSNTISGSGALIKTGAGTLTLTGAQTYTGSTTLSNGLLQLGDGTTNGFIIGDVSMAGGSLAMNVAAGSTLKESGLISGTGNFTKLGTGTTILTRDNTYTGTTTVSAGALYIQGKQVAATGATTVASGATFGGTGTIGGNVTVANGATLTPTSSDGTAGILTINGSLVLNDLSSLNYQFGKVNGVAHNSRIDVNGDLTLDGRLNVTVPAGGTFSAGVYRIFNYTGTLTNKSFVLGSVPASTTLALQSAVPGQVNLVNTTGQLLAFWDGMDPANFNRGGGEGGNGIWSLQGLTAWADVTGTSNSQYGNKSFAVFGGAPGTVSVDNSGGQILTSGMQFTTDGYVINGGAITLVNSPVDGGSPELRVGDGSAASSSMTATINSVLQGAVSLTKTDLGTLTLTGNNTYSGGTAVNGGVLQVSNDANLGDIAGGLSFDGATLATTGTFASARGVTLNTGGGTIDTASGTTLTMSGVANGSGSLTKTDSGQLVLTGNNTYSGGTAVDGGVLQVSADANLGSLSGALSLDGGTLATTGSFATARATTLNAGGGTVDTAAGTTLTLNGVVDGSGSLTKVDSGKLVLTGNNIYTGGTAINGGVLQIAANANLGDASGALSIDGATLATTGSFVSARAVTLKSGGGTVDTASGTTLTLNGVADGSGSLTKTDTGTLVLTGNNTYRDGTVINGGIVQVSADANLGDAAGALSFNGGTLATTSSFSSTRSATLNAGGGTIDTASGTTLTINGVTGGSGSLTKTNSGTLILTANNTWGGGTTISGGTLQLGNGGTSGSLLGNVTDNGSLAFNRSDLLAIAGVISGSGAVNQIGTGTTVLSGNNTWGGGTTISGGMLVAQNGAAMGTGAVSNGSTLQLDFASDGSLANVLSGSGSLSKTGSGTATLTAAGSSEGDVAVDAGTLAFAQTGAFTAASLSTAAGADTLISQEANLVLSGALTQSDGALLTVAKGASPAITADSANLNGTLNLSGFATAAPTSASALAGTQYTVIRTTHGISGDFTDVNLHGAASSLDYLRLAGRVSGNDYNVGYGLSWLEGVTDGTGDFTLTNASDTFNVDVALNDQTAGAYTSGWDGKTLTKAGAGTLILSAVNGYTGDTVLNAGTLRTGVANAFAQSANVSVASGATLDLNGYDQMANNLSGAGDVTLGSGTLTENAVSDTTFSGLISGTGALIKTGSGAFTLSGNNTWGGGTTISGGTLVAQNGAAMGTGAVSNNSALQLDFATDSSVANVLSGSGSLSKTGSGTATLIAAGSSEGAVAVDAGTLAFAQTGAFTAASLSTAAGADTLISQGANLVLSGALTQADGASLTVAKGTSPAITADSANLNGTLNLSGFATAAPTSASTLAGTQYTVIHTAHGISGDFSSVDLNGAASSLDYLRLAGRVSGNDYNVGYGLSWLEGVTDGTGSFTLTNAADTFNVDVALNDQAAGTYVRGWDGKTLTKAGAGTLFLSAVNGYTGDTVLNAGTLRTEVANAFAQSANVSVASGAILDLNGHDQTANNLSGAGDVTLGNGTLTENALSDTTFSGLISGTGGLVKTGNSTFTLTSNNTWSGGTTISGGTLELDNGGSVQGAIAVASGATLAVNRSADYTLNNTLTGKGLVTVGTADHAFDFASAAAGAGFSGTVALHDATFSLGGSNAGALSAATLRLDSGSVTSVEDGTQSIGGLAINGGRVIFDATIPAQVDAASLVQADMLDVSGTGVVQVTLPVPYVLPTPAPSTGLSLTEQDDLNVTTRLASGTTVTGSAGALTLEDQSGNVISAAQQISVQQDGNLVAVGTYDYRLSTGANQDGLYVSYGLTQLALQVGQTLTLAEHAGATGSAADMSAKLTGSGSLLVDAGTGILSLSNTLNDFTGDTTVAAGTLQAGARNVIATSGNVTVNAGTLLDSNGYDQALNNLTGAGTVTNSTTTAMTLTLNDTATSVFAGDITGTQLALVQATGTQVLTGNNSWGAGTTVDTGATLQLGNGGTTGSMTGDVTDNGTLVFSRSDAMTFAGMISGDGAVVQTGSGTTLLTGTNTYSGGTTISAGTLQLGNGGTSGSLTGDVTDNGTLTFNRSDLLTLTGVISGNGTVDQAGTGATVLSGNNTYGGGTTISGGTLQLGNGGASGSLTGDVLNNGTLTFNRSDVTTFTGVISGSGHVSQVGTGSTVLTGTNTYRGGTTISGGTLQLGNGGTGGSVAGAIAVASGATLAVDWGADYALNNTLTGKGLVTVGTADHAFDFASAAAGTGFSGTVALHDATFSLGGNNTGALSAATLRLDSGSVTTVEDGTQNIGGLAINGGQVIFDATAPAQVDASSLVQADMLDVSGTGVVQVTLPAPYVLSTPTPSTDLFLTEQDDLNAVTRLVAAASVTGTAGALTLEDQSGNVISAAQQISVQQGGNLVAVGTYDYRLSTGANQDGLYVSYGLTQLALQAGQTLTLADRVGATGAEADMSAKLTGSGSLLVDAGTGILSLSNTLNDFTGDTTVAAGTLQAGARNVIATSGNVSVNAGTILDSNGYDQTLNNLTGAGTVTNSTTTAMTLTLNDTATSVFAGDITGTQLALVQATGTQVLTGNNNWGAGTTVDTGATLQLGNGGTTGSMTGDVTDNGTLAFSRSDAMTFAGIISGDGAVEQTGSGTTVLSGNNTYRGGTTISAGTLQLTAPGAAGTGAINVNTAQGDATRGLELAFKAAGNIDNQLTGTGTTTVSGAQAIITGSNAGYAGNWSVSGTGSLAVTAHSLSSEENLGTGGVDITAGGTVSAQTSAAFSFDNALTGSGVLAASSQGQAFSFGNGVGSGFTGSLELTDNTFALSGNNTLALSHATLNVGSGNVTTVGEGNQQIQGLVINGGTLHFDASAPENSVADSLITALRLDISHSGTVAITVPAPYTPLGIDAANTVNLLAQDEANVQLMLVSAQQTTGSGGALQLVDQNGKVVTAVSEIGVNQNGNTVAQATYDYRLTSGAAADGLYVNYGLTKLDLQADQTLTLAEESGATGAAADMSAQITGAGNLAINAGFGAVSLSNTNNDYRGQTTVMTGTLRAEADNALGNTGLLNLLTSTSFDLNGKTQTLGQLQSTEGSSLNLNGGTLNVSQGGTSAGELSGGGQLNVLGGTLNVQGGNPGLLASTRIASGASLSLDNVQGLGSSAITDNGSLVLNGANGTMGNDIAGVGELVKLGDGEVVLTGKTNWTGETHLEGGSLVLDGSQGGAQLVSNVIASEGTALSLRNNATLTGWVDPADMHLDGTSSWNLTADSVVNSMDLAGTVNFVAEAYAAMSSGHTLTVTQWNGHDGTVVLNTVLGDDASVTDKIVVNGDTSGNTFVKINNAGGHGAQTVQGIEVVQVKGQSDGTFTPSGRIVAGAYDYNLVKQGPDWYLTNFKPLSAPSKPAGIPTVRPESASYAANLAAANTLFILGLHDHQGETQYTDVLTGERKTTSLWLRQVGGHNRWEDTSGQLNTQSNRYVSQLGGDVMQWSPDGLQRWHIGVMAGYGNNSSNSHSDVTGYRSSGSVNGYSAGLYATWYQNEDTQQGAYLDSWAQYGWFNNEVKGQNVAKESCKSSGTTASLELGYTHKLGDFTTSQDSEIEWDIQPQAQAIWMGVGADNHTESNGTRVAGEGDGDLQTRLGVRTYLKGHSKLDAGTGRDFEPFVEINWIHNTQSFGTRMDGVSLNQAGSRDRADVKAGVEGQLSPKLSVWGSVDVQAGGSSYSDASATLGVKYNF